MFTLTEQSQDGMYLLTCQKQNYGDIIVGRFNGMMSDLRYFNTALNVFHINNITLAGPNLKTAVNQRDTKFDYLSNIWFKPQA